MRFRVEVYLSDFLLILMTNNHLISVRGEPENAVCQTSVFLPEITGHKTSCLINPVNETAAMIMTLAFMTEVLHCTNLLQALGKFCRKKKIKEKK